MHTGSRREWCFLNPSFSKTTVPRTPRAVSMKGSHRDLICRLMYCSNVHRFLLSINRSRGVHPALHRHIVFSILMCIWLNITSYWQINAPCNPNIYFFYSLRPHPTKHVFVCQLRKPIPLIRVRGCWIWMVLRKTRCSKMWRRKRQTYVFSPEHDPAAAVAVEAHLLSRNHITRSVGSRMSFLTSKKWNYPWEIVLSWWLYSNFYIFVMSDWYVGSYYMKRFWNAHRHKRIFFCKCIYTRLKYTPMDVFELGQMAVCTRARRTWRQKRYWPVTRFV